MMAFHDGTSHDVVTKVGDYNTLMYGQFSLATGMSICKSGGTPPCPVVPDPLSGARFCLRNDLYCVEWGVKLYSLTDSLGHGPSVMVRGKVI